MTAQIANSTAAAAGEPDQGPFMSQLLFDRFMNARGGDHTTLPGISDDRVYC
jgi:hypothetical protein